MLASEERVHRRSQIEEAAENQIRWNQIRMSNLHLTVRVTKFLPQIYHVPQFNNVKLKSGHLIQQSLPTHRHRKVQWTRFFANLHSEKLTTVCRIQWTFIYLSSASVCKKFWNIFFNSAIRCHLWLDTNGAHLSDGETNFYYRSEAMMWHEELLGQLNQAWKPSLKRSANSWNFVIASQRSFYKM